MQEQAIPNRHRIVLILAGAAVVAGASFALLRGAGDDTPASPSTSTGPSVTTTTGTATTPSTPGPVTVVRVRAGRPVGGVAGISVTSGDVVRFTVTSDAPEEIHVHGYDLSKDVGPASPARFAFPARLEGVWEVELERSAVPILRLTVRP